MITTGLRMLADRMNLEVTLGLFALLLAGICYVQYTRMNSKGKGEGKNGY